MVQWPRWSELVLGIVALGAVLFVGIGVGRSGGGTGQGRLRVSASGQSQVAPNEAQVVLGTNVTATTAAEALGKLAVISARLVKVVAQYHIAPRDVQTSNLNVGQNYGPNGVQQGYQASETFTVTVTDLPQVGRVVTAVIGTGANQVNGINLIASDPNAGVGAAVQQALKAAHRQAVAEAAELGVQLGPVLSVQVNQNQPVAPVYFGAAQPMKASAAPSIPVSPGTQTVSAQVSVVYAFR